MFCKGKLAATTSSEATHFLIFFNMLGMEVAMQNHKSGKNIRALDHSNPGPTNKKVNSKDSDEKKKTQTFPSFTRLLYPTTFSSVIKKWNKKL